VLDVSGHGGGVLIRVLGGAVDERIGRRKGRCGVDGGSHGGTVEGMMRVRDVMAVGGRELGRAVGPIRAMMEIHCGRE